MSTLNIRPLSQSLQLIAQKELFEDPNYIEQNLDLLKQWLRQSAHIKARTDDQFLIAFLRGCKYNLEEAKQKIDLYYTYRTQLAEVVGRRDPLDDKINEVTKLGVSLPLPITDGDPSSPRITFVRINAYDPSRVSAADVFTQFIMTGDVLMIEDDNITVAGQIIVCDLVNISMGHVLQFHPTFLKKVTMIWEESSPIRKIGFHFINAPEIFEQVFALFKSLLSEKLTKRVFMHSSMDSLYSMVRQEMLPNDYGGSAGFLESLTDEWEKKLLSYRDYFLTDILEYGVDEDKRLGAAKNPLLGINGSFKPLKFE